MGTARSERTASGASDHPAADNAPTSAQKTVITRDLGGNCPNRSGLGLACPHAQANSTGAPSLLGRALHRSHHPSRDIAGITRTTRKTVRIMSNGIQGRRALLMVIAAITLGTCQSGWARYYRPGLLPNGYNFACANCHDNPNGGGPRNAFGQAVRGGVDTPLWRRGR